MKDAKGHGSDAKSGGNMSVPDQHQHAIARDTVKNPMKGFLGGPNAAEAETILRSRFGYTDAQINKLKGMNEPRVGGPGMKGAAIGSASSDYWAAKSLAQGGGPKAAPPETHPAMKNAQGHEYGSPEAIKDFTNQYGGPRDHAAEQRGFNRGAREIKRLKDQGK